MSPDDSRLAFYVDAQHDNPYMASFCISYISTQLEGIQSLARPNLETVSRLELTKESYNTTELVKKSPFIDYAVVAWQAHLVDGKVGLKLEAMMRRLQELLTYEFTVLWIELCVLLHQEIIWTIERSCKRTMSWAEYAMVPAQSPCHETIEFLWAWSKTVLSIINEYGSVIEKYPYEIHYLDLENIARCECPPHSPSLPEAYTAMQGQNLREQTSKLRAVDKLQPSVKAEPCRQLLHNVENPADSDLGFLLYDRTRGVYITAEVEVHNETETLWVQERATGHRLQPVRSPLNDFGGFYNGPESPPMPITRIYLRLISAILSRDHTYLAILYGNHDGNFYTSIWIIERPLDFQTIRYRRPWARRLHIFQTQNSLFVDSCLPLTVGQDDLFYCPGGQLHPERGFQKRLPDYLIDSTRPDTHARENFDVVTFAGNGQTLVKLDRKNGVVKEVSWLKDNTTEPRQWRMPADRRHGESVYLRAVSQTARFIVYETLIEDESSALFYLLDYQGNPEQLQVDCSRSHNSTIFHFSQDEQSLLSIYPRGPQVEYF